MPRGSYLVDGRPEAFSCAPGPAGWRYVSAGLDLVCDSTFRPVRFAVSDGPAAPGGAWVRGGGLRLDDGVGVLEWTTAAAPDVVRRAAVSGVLTPSVGSLVALLRQVAGVGGDPASALVDVAVVGGPALAVLTARRVVRRTGAEAHDAPQGVLLAETWHVDDPDTGRRRVVHLAGDVVLAAEGGEEPAVELAALESPPWQPPPR